MKILLFGKNGQVGWELNRSLLPLGDVIALGREEADFLSPEGLRKIVQDIAPDVIVNAVAYTAVDKAEESEALALMINGESLSVLADEALKINALLVHFSTDYVFDGTGKNAYLETDATNPVNAYGRTKLAGERAVQMSGCDYLIFRTSWVYAARGNNFLLTILKLAKEREQLSVVSDQKGSPTSARLIAEVSLQCINQSINERKNNIFTSDLYHLTADQCSSWHGFAEEIVGLLNKKKAEGYKIKSIMAIPTASYPTPAKRPMNSQLDSGKLEKKFGLVMPSWEKTLQLTIDEII